MSNKELKKETRGRKIGSKKVEEGERITLWLGKDYLQLVDRVCENMLIHRREFFERLIDNNTVNVKKTIYKDSIKNKVQFSHRFKSGKQSRQMTGEIYTTKKNLGGSEYPKKLVKDKI